MVAFLEPQSGSKWNKRERGSEGVREGVSEGERERGRGGGRE